MPLSTQPTAPAAKIDGETTTFDRLGLADLNPATDEIEKNTLNSVFILLNC
jgi:hypothetical protein